MGILCGILIFFNIILGTDNIINSAFSIKLIIHNSLRLNAITSIHGYYIIFHIISKLVIFSFPTLIFLEVVYFVLPRFISCLLSLIA